MGLQDIGAEDVRGAARIHDDLGRDEFLRKYGFSESRSYEVVVDGRQYPSKAILGVAHEFATGTPLTSLDFTGGQSVTVPKLQQLGFQVVSSPSADSERQGYMLLWNPNGFFWPESDRLEILLETLEGELVPGRWSMHANRDSVRIGDRVYLRKTTIAPRGIIASGYIAELPFEEAHWGDGNNSTATYVGVEWDAMVDSEDVFDLSGLAEQYPSATWSGRQGGMVVPAESLDSLERAWMDHVGRVYDDSQEGSEEVFTPSEEIEVRYARALTKMRRHQAKFRKLLLNARENRCEYPGCGVVSTEILEAAHIIPDSEGGEPTLENGLLLCRNHHRALDVGLMALRDDGEFEWMDQSYAF